MEGRNLGCGNWLGPSLCHAGDLIPSSPARSFCPTARGRDPSVNRLDDFILLLILDTQMHGFPFLCEGQEGKGMPCPWWQPLCPPSLLGLSFPASSSRAQLHRVGWLRAGRGNGCSLLSAVGTQGSFLPTHPCFGENYISAMQQQL